MCRQMEFHRNCKYAPDVYNSRAGTNYRDKGALTDVRGGERKTPSTNHQVRQELKPVGSMSAVTPPPHSALGGRVREGRITRSYDYESDVVGRS